MQGTRCCSGGCSRWRPGLSTCQLVQIMGIVGGEAFDRGVVGDLGNDDGEVGIKARLVVNIMVITKE